MIEILTGTFIISLLHALIPSHWLPLVSLAKAQKWSESELIKVGFSLSLAHVLSTVLLGLMLGGLAHKFYQSYQQILLWLGPAILILSGVYFIYRHHTHHHFHIDDQMMEQTKTRKQVIYALLAFMFLSPCLEIEAYFINASFYGWKILGLSLTIYVVFSMAGMLTGILLANRGLNKINSHKWEHNAGIVTAITMILTGLLSLIFH
ncbi:MAG: hypothetical protein V9E90_10215 [Saprospiraceae bacterium]|jgi:sulfite exporter TauE/SafE